MIEKFKKNKIMLILIIIPLIIMGIYASIVNQKERNSTFMLERISTICEISTVSYNYSNIISFKENKKIQDIEIPFTQKSFLIKYEGLIKGGVDIKNIKIVKNDSNTIIIKLKNSKIVQHTIDEKNIYVYDEKTSLFNKLSIKDVFNEISNEKEKVEKKLIQDGFLQKTNKNTQAFLTNFLKSLGYNKIQINFE